MKHSQINHNPTQKLGCIQNSTSDLLFYEEKGPVVGRVDMENLFILNEDNIQTHNFHVSSGKMSTNKYRVLSSCQGNPFTTPLQKIHSP